MTRVMSGTLLSQRIEEALTLISHAVPPESCQDCPLPLRPFCQRSKKKKIRPDTRKHAEAIMSLKIAVHKGNSAAISSLEKWA